MDYELFLLGLATASRVEIVTHLKAALNLLLLATTWIKAVTHYKAVPFLLRLATTWFTWHRDAFYDRTTCCLFLLEILGLTHFKAAVFLLLLELKSQLPFKAVPVLLLLAATCLEIVHLFCWGFGAATTLLSGPNAGNTDLKREREREREKRGHTPWGRMHLCFMLLKPWWIDWHLQPSRAAQTFRRHDAVAFHGL